MLRRMLQVARPVHIRPNGLVIHSSSRSLSSSSKRPNALTSAINTTFKDVKSLVRPTVTVILGLFVYGHLCTEYFFTWGPCYGISMLPTFNAIGDHVIISKYYRRGRGIQVGDLVSYMHPINEGESGLKRVLGMPGDFVQRDTPGVGAGTMMQVPKGHCWVVGDNLKHSRDSRMFGPLPLALINGKVITRMSSPWYLPQRIQTFAEEADID